MQVNSISSANSYNKTNQCQPEFGMALKNVRGTAAEIRAAAEAIKPLISEYPGIDFYVESREVAGLAHEFVVTAIERGKKFLGLFGGRKQVGYSAGPDIKFHLIPLNPSIEPNAEQKGRMTQALIHNARNSVANLIAYSKAEAEGREALQAALKEARGNENVRAAARHLKAAQKQELRRGQATKRGLPTLEGARPHGNVSDIIHET